MLGRRWTSGTGSASSSTYSMDSSTTPAHEWSSLKREAQHLESKIERALQDFGRVVSTRTHRDEG